MIEKGEALDILASWWRFERQWVPVDGYPSECPSTRGWMSSKQYEDTNHAADTDAHGRYLLHVGHTVNGIHEPYRTALYVVARNNATGVSVWRSPRLPEDGSALADVVSEALALFQERL